MHVAVIIPAAGSSERYKHAARAEGNDSPRSKLDEELGGRPVLHRTVELFTNRPDVHTIIVAGPPDPAEMEEFRTRHADKLAVLGVTVIEGDESSRSQTVRNALAHVPDSCTHVAVHDAARPGVPPEMLERILDAARTNAAVIPALPVADTIKRVADAPELAADPDPLAAILGDEATAAPPARKVTETLDRAGVVAAQTPQVFKKSLFVRAYEAESPGATDDAALVERLGEPVLVVEGDVRAMKITTPADLRALRAMLNLTGPADRAAHKRF
ncbi:MAG: 2-C-methyl-D-erythritol 4-phosphate cytidylyltransferase [Phycisphaeraceae bacterium]|nr:MAG: 2-C-methyl-D-erythritol 4-phosphate cytidylyltransferase [Phycisphaeraceae bacterium]